MKVRIHLGYHIDLVTEAKEGEKENVLKQLKAQFKGTLSVPALPPVGTKLFPTTNSSMDLIVSEVLGEVMEDGVVHYLCHLDTYATTEIEEPEDSDITNLVTYFEADRKWLELVQIRLDGNAVQVGLWNKKGEALTHVEWVEV